MKPRIGQVIVQHIVQHASLYIFTIVLFMMGVIFGTLTIHSLGYSQQSQLFTYFQQFVDISKEHDIGTRYALTHTFLHYIKTIGIIWILGLSIIGLPIILILLFLKGVFIGFTVGFLVYQLEWKGFLLAMFTVVPHNLLMVPFIWFMSVLSISFSLKLIAHLVGSQRHQHALSISKYVGSMVFAILFVFVIALVETYFSTYMLWILS